MAGNRHEWQEGRNNYQAFLLRCWQEDDLLNAGEPDPTFSWYFALVQVDDGSQAKCFTSLEELVVYLRGRLSQATRDDAESLGETFDQTK